MKLRGYFHPAYVPQTTGLNKEGGKFWIGFMDEDDSTDGLVVIELVVWADDSPTKSTFASLRTHHDGVKVVRKLEEIGFLAIFEGIQASTFYDVVQCCARCDIPIIYHGDGSEESRKMTPRKIYEILYADAVK